jgi:hypothetical protein
MKKTKKVTKRKKLDVYGKIKQRVARSYSAHLVVYAGPNVERYRYVYYSSMRDQYLCTYIAASLINGPYIARSSCFMLDAVSDSLSDLIKAMKAYDSRMGLKVRML